MTVVNQSWLYKNDTRKYPLVDDAHGGTTAVVDISVSIPEDFGLGAKVYVSYVAVSENAAVIDVALEGYIGADGSSVIATASVEAPDAFRLYPLTGVVPGVLGYVVFGSACQSGRAPVSDHYDSSTGALLESVVARYPVAPASAFIVNGTRLDGTVVLTGLGGLVVEVDHVYFQDSQETRPAMVFRLERDNETMRAPVAECDMPAEVANRPDLVTSINGVIPDPSGVIYLQLRSAMDFQYIDGHVATDPVTGLPLYDNTRPLVELVPEGPHELVIKDNFDYRVLCTGKRSLTAISKSSALGNCVNCISQAGNVGGGVDLNDGLPVVMVGSAIWRDVLVVYWAFLAQGTPVAGGNPLEIVLSNPVGPTLAENGDPLNPLQVIGLTKIEGSPPKFPSDLKPGTLTPITPGTQGAPVYSVYKLNRPAVAGEPFVVKLPKASVIKNAPPAFPVNYPVYHSAPKDDTCLRYARDPESAPSTEFT